MLTNGEGARELYLELYREIFAELAGLATPSPLRPAAEPPVVDLARHTGRYERAGAILDVTEGENGLRLKATVTGALAGLVPDPPEIDLVPLDDSQFLYRTSEDASWASLVFYPLPTGEQYVHMALRASPKVS